MLSPTDLDQIHQLKARYFRLMDTKQWDLLRDVFTVDVRIDTTEDSGTVIDGVDDYLPYPCRYLMGWPSGHHSSSSIAQMPVA